MVPCQTLNPQNKDPDRIKKQDKKVQATLDYRGNDFPIKVKDYEIIEERFNINVNDMMIEFLHYMYQKNLMNKF